MGEIKHKGELTITERIEGDFRNCDEHYSGMLETYRDAIKQLENSLGLEPHVEGNNINGARTHGTKDGKEVVQRLLGYVSDGQLSTREVIELLNREIEKIKGIVEK